MSKERWAVIGYKPPEPNVKRNIGAEVVHQLGQAEVADRHHLESMPRFVMRASGIYVPSIEDVSGLEPSGHTCLEDIDDLPEVAFLAIPSYDDGKEAFAYISHWLKRGGTVITAEKGAMANFFPELREMSYDFRRLGINATVGGGNRFIEEALMRCRDRKNVTQIHAVLNGTLTKIMSSIAPLGGTPYSLGQGVEEAVDLKYAEPGHESPIDVIRGEAEGDIPKKTAIFFNAVLADEPIDWRDLKFELKEDEIHDILEEAEVRRFIVSIYSKRFAKNHRWPESDIKGGFYKEHEDWIIVGGFRHTQKNPLFRRLAELSGPDNGMIIGLGPNEKDGIYPYSGPGAGPSPTVMSMLDDRLKMESLRP